MAVTKEQKQQILKKFQRADLDTGSPEVQIALLTYRINAMTVHSAANKHDHHSRKGLVTCVNQRRKLLDYLRRKNLKGYEGLIKELEIRK